MLGRAQIVAQELVRLACESRDVHFVGARYIPVGASKPRQPIGTPLKHCIKLSSQPPPKEPLDALGSPPAKPKRVRATLLSVLAKGVAVVLVILLLF